MLKGKNVVLGVTGGIAAYKACEIISGLKKIGANIDVIMTRSATEFITPYTFQSLTGNAVVVNMFETPKYWDMEHISLAQKSDILLVAPATANLIGKVATGIADDMLSTTIMASDKPVVFAPAMNTKMFENPGVQENMKTLLKRGYHIIPPKGGMLACGDEGQGKLQEVSIILEELERIYDKELQRENKDLEGIKFLVTAGPTREIIDPVRFLSNHSTGKMGYEIAKAIIKRGGEVKLISGPSGLEAPEGADTVLVESAEEMFEAVQESYPWCDVLIKSAAVSDYRPKTREGQKVKKDSRKEEIQLTLVRNPDILFEMGKIKGPGKIHVGFAAETEKIKEHGEEKIQKKNLDFIVANDVTEEGAGFAHHTNIVHFIDKNGDHSKTEKVEKSAIAHEILDKVLLKKKSENS
ncbi:bifunctional phosphopantothenoylcysteine decarboxylase/phosphopantothenate--cysteine ligase CoaBC [Isachenkonia alkalipeptolytica]|uniref:Coenzyme A biosynthesis bifunctional protein CoaBC n=1 Tax=Isachenkonia alkalipeptolytica TaxID=2565777 RepID=A0AA43XNM1_9CLOT|nr:bifunctional phosphopantothenoylcysteine decarboxylase/phosphopantothenate--cysteine ligase CoaBC [Isachenkonia alkalipeptolytica]NBG89135.1 bifunctional phosphopantothenoylcysteine decarboxylase/phosphopantothenate--cysteine ligase CoaBC [Isachenkonia alkalipeptolytica]